jgi:hypothetical protein
LLCFRSVKDEVVLPQPHVDNRVVENQLDEDKSLIEVNKGTIESNLDP